MSPVLQMRMLARPKLASDSKSWRQPLYSWNNRDVLLRLTRRTICLTNKIGRENDCLTQWSHDYRGMRMPLTRPVQMEGDRR